MHQNSWNFRGFFCSFNSRNSNQWVNQIAVIFAVWWCVFVILNVVWTTPHYGNFCVCCDGGESSAHFHDFDVSSGILNDLIYKNRLTEIGLCKNAMKWYAWVAFRSTFDCFLSQTGLRCSFQRFLRFETYSFSQINQFHIIQLNLKWKQLDALASKTNTAVRKLHVIIIIGINQTYERTTNEAIFMRLHTFHVENWIH